MLIIIILYMYFRVSVSCWYDDHNHCNMPLLIYDIEAGYKAGKEKVKEGSGYISFIKRNCFGIKLEELELSAWLIFRTGLAGWTGNQSQRRSSHAMNHPTNRRFGYGKTIKDS
ncbi:hypothetical protein QVD17_09379 [Tagetes erecta]|uniref:Uncharacterized protein n=1 Tax=Tagetes erecta TaxID=13708 RepID=A0AAD8P582_TARER|nr:hypothetical protein QVD17_09379 [Tagetes erecta]